ncbi:MAG: glycerol-3-phosphate dehydrogenase [Elusimicrobia bacterium RIFOXYA2_FULL_50_26]|nr:MAG: glycerol-3-phosphate dehydrogenase [Elusimicrobia bacterium RIFOXYA2_FULL_50_26]OGS25076.1 MAG: glycerol-3-phosphate dehydrogenase [Elusimicrobia bacterium RIFOXYB2_FULL_50_12]
MSNSIGVLGAGSWGCTLAALLAEKGNSVTLWEFNHKQAEELDRWRSLSFFHYVNLPKEIVITSTLKEAIENKDFIIFTLPSHTVRAVAGAIAGEGVNLSNTIIITASKGIENETLKRMSEIIAETLPATRDKIVALSGPTHAEEVAQKIATAATVASLNSDAAAKCQELLSTAHLRVYTHTDIAGVETGGALKNIFAIAAGICDGLGLGDNTKAALVTRGMREMVRLGMQLGGQPSTFFGLTGMGDLIVTCFSTHSRNRALGEKVGKGKSLSQSERELIMIAEGVRTSRSARELALKYNLELPIIEKVYQVLYEDKSPLVAVQELMQRESKQETELVVGTITI